MSFLYNGCIYTYEPKMTSPIAPNPLKKNYGERGVLVYWMPRSMDLGLKQKIEIDILCEKCADPDLALRPGGHGSIHSHVALLDQWASRMGPNSDCNTSIAVMFQL